MSRRVLVLILCVCLLALGICGCADNKPGTTTESGASAGTTAATTETTQPATVEEVDYAAKIKLDLSSETAKQKVTVKTYVDGDTVHFHVPTSVMENGVLKGRFLAINTPESTGKIEEYGKTASAFTREKLSGASSIIIESETDKWDPDSTGDRYLVWVWYRNNESEEYRNLNIEILQNGLAIANKSAQNRYGDTCMAALNQAKALKLYVHSGQKDPNFYYGEAVELTLKELRTNIDAYNGIKVAFTGVITRNYSNSVYVESYDAETDMYYGMSVYYGFGLSGEGLDILSLGNEVRIVGSVQYYEAGGTYQVSDLTYRMMKPNDPGNIQRISEGHAPAYVPVKADTFVNGKVEVTVDEEVKTFDFAELAMGSSVSMKNLKVKEVYTTKNEDSSSYGAMTLTCEVDGITVSVRTIPLYDENNELITEGTYKGKTIDVQGIVDYYDGQYQIKVFTPEDIAMN